jgi:hypothetical protein
VNPSDDDPIVEEIHRIRAAIAMAHGNDIRAIAEALREEQQEHRELVVSRQPKPVAAR